MKMYSRKNDVSAENNRVFKRFTDEASYCRELETVTRLINAKIAVPKVIVATNKTIQYELIKGVTYHSLVDSFEQKHADALISWLKGYYCVMGRQRGDVNLRNFIYCEDIEMCIGVDFEDECIIGDPEIDFGKIIAFAVTYDPPFTDKKKHCAKLLLATFKSVGADEVKMRSAYELEMHDIIHRRKDRKYSFDQALIFWEELSSR